MMIQPAQSTHAHRACELLYESGPAAFSYIFCHSHGPEVKTFLRHLFRTKHTMFSHVNHLVCIDKNDVIATIGFFSRKSHNRTFIHNAINIFSQYGVRGIWKGLTFERHLVKPPKNDCLYLCHIAVHESQRGKGIATRLIKHMEKHAKQANYKKLSLDVAQNNHRAINLYLSLGFRIISLNESYTDKLDNHIYMEKAV